MSYFPEASESSNYQQSYVQPLEADSTDQLDATALLYELAGTPDNIIKINSLLGGPFVSVVDGQVMVDQKLLNRHYAQQLNAVWPPDTQRYFTYCLDGLRMLRDLDRLGERERNIVKYDLLYFSAILWLINTLLGKYQK